MLRWLGMVSESWRQRYAYGGVMEGVKVAIYEVGGEPLAMIR